MSSGAMTRRGFAGLLVAGAPWGAAWACSTPQVATHLFVGNSFTRQHGIADRVSGLAAQSDVEIVPFAVTVAGARLDHFAQTMPRLSHDCDHIGAETLVLQDFSTEPLTDLGRARSAAAMGLFSRQFRHSVLFATWARRAGHPLYDRAGMPGTPEAMTDIVHAHYAEQARRLGATLAPVGLAWQRAIAAGHGLHAADGYHANRRGAHLTALVLAYALGVALPKDDPFTGLAHAAFD